MRNFLGGGLLAASVFSASLITPQFTFGEAPSGEELKEVASLAKKVGERENLYDVPDELKPVLTASSIKYEVPEALLAGLIKKESEFRNIWGTDGSGRGIAQIDAYWHPEVPDNKAFEPNYALPWAAKYLKGLKDEYGNWYNALRAYNGGSNYAAWGVGYITTLYANTIYEFAREYAASNDIEDVPDVAESISVKSISAQLSNIENPVSTMFDSLNQLIEETKNEPCNEASCILPTDFKEVNIAQVILEEVEPEL